MENIAVDIIKSDSTSVEMKCKGVIVRVSSGDAGVFVAKQDDSRQSAPMASLIPDRYNSLEEACRANETDERVAACISVAKRLIGGTAKLGRSSEFVERLATTMKQFRVAPRNGSTDALAAVAGNVYWFRYGWDMTEFDRYPGEMAWIVDDPSYPSDTMPMCFAAGDLVAAGNPTKPWLSESVEDTTKALEVMVSEREMRISELSKVVDTLKAKVYRLQEDERMRKSQHHDELNQIRKDLKYPYKRLKAFIEATS